MSEEGTPKSPDIPSASGQSGAASKPPEESSPTAIQQVVPLAGRRPAFRDVRRQLNQDELAQTGAVKLILEILDRTDEEVAELRGFRESYHTEARRCAVLEEKVRTVNAIEIAYGAGVGLGGAIVGLASFFWQYPPAGWICLLVGFALLIAGIVVRRVKL